MVAAVNETISAFAVHQNKMSTSSAGRPKKTSHKQRQLNVEQDLDSVLAMVKRNKRVELNNDSENARKKSSPKSTVKLSRKKLVNKMKTVPSSNGGNSGAGNIVGSEDAGRIMLEWILAPMSAAEFTADYWDKKPHIHHRDREAGSNYYGGVISTEIFDSILRDQNVLFGKNLDVTTFSDDVRETHNPEGRAYPGIVWDYYKNGCSLRFINPQTFHDPLWNICSTLQDFFGSMVGANLYLTPPGTQGFAPHYDDVDVMILQIEGKKSWSVYYPKDSTDVLARFSSPNFSCDDLPCAVYDDVILEAGDWLYMPRGTIHQAKCLSNSHSLHVTVSFGQLNTLGDLLKIALPDALEKALQRNSGYRAGLPFDFLKHNGVSVSMVPDKTWQQISKRQILRTNLKSLFSDIWDHVDIDSSVDKMGTKFMHDSLPPFLDISEASRCITGAGDRWMACGVVSGLEMESETKVRLIRTHCLRLINESFDKFVIHYSVENSREYHAAVPQSMEIELDLIPALLDLMKAYPKYVKISALSSQVDLDRRMKLMQDLWECKLILTKRV